MTTTVVPAAVPVEAARTPPLKCLIVITAAAVFVSADKVENDIMTALHSDGFVYGVEWNLPAGVHLASSARSGLIGDVQAAVHAALRRASA